MGMPKIGHPPIAAAPLHNGPTMSSVEIVDWINDERKESANGGGWVKLTHRDFTAKVPLVLGSHAAKFSAPQIYGNNNTRSIYIFPKREACLMVMSYSYDLQAKVFDHMTELEAKLEVARPSLPNFADPAAAARAWADAVDNFHTPICDKLLYMLHVTPWRP